VTGVPPPLVAWNEAARRPQLVVVAFVILGNIWMAGR
jgi:hypothetical protein